MREDIVGMLKNAIERGGRPEKIAESLINSGYNVIEVRQALAYVTGGTLSSLNSSSVPQIQIKPVIAPPTPQIPSSSHSIYQQAQPTNQSHYLQLPVAPVENNVKSNNSVNMRVILLISVLVLLIGGLIMTLIFKEDILNIFG